MTRALLAAFALCTIGVAALAASVQKARPAFPAAPAQLATLEREYAEAPYDANRRTALIRAYFEAKAPGAASAVVYDALRSARAAGAPPIELLHQAASVEFQMGRASVAADLEHEARTACAAVTPQPRLCVEVERRHALLQEFVRLGIEDPIANPEQSALAYQRAGRSATFSAVGLDL